MTRPDTTAEKLLRATARTTLTRDQTAHLADEAARVMDWTEIIQTALGHGTAGLLCRHLLTLPPGLVPADIGAAALSYIDHLHASHATGVAQLLDLLDRFTRAGITAVPFKGPALAQRAYPEPALRQFSDLDILISARDIAPTMRLLQDLGYRSQHAGLPARHHAAYLRYNGQDVLHAVDRLPVEPHWQFAQRTLHAAMDIDGMLARAVPLELGGHQIRSLSPVDSVLAAALHGSKDQWLSLRAVTDLAELLCVHPDLDWPVLLHRAKASGIHRMVLLGAALTQRVLDVPLPDIAARGIAADATCQRLAARAHAALFTGPHAIPSIFVLNRFRWQMRERLPDRVAYAARTLLTPRVQHFGIIDLPDTLRFLYPLLKVGHDFIALPLWRATRRTVGKSAA